MFYEDGPRGYTQGVLVSNAKCKPRFCLFTRKLHRELLMVQNQYCYQQKNAKKTNTSHKVVSFHTVKTVLSY